MNARISEISSANASIVALSSGLASAVSVNVVQSASIVALSSGVVSGLSSANASILVTNASVGLLSASLSLEIARAITNETNLSTAISTTNATAVVLSNAVASAISVNTVQTASLIELSNGLASEVSSRVALSSSLSSNFASLTTGLSLVQRQMVKSKVVPINSSTIQSDYGMLEPMYLATYPISSGNPVDGWWFSKTSGAGSISWTTSLSSAVYLGLNLAQISFTCYISSTPTTIADLPYLVLPFIQQSSLNNLLLAFAAANLSNFTGPGEYTFIANLNGSSPGVTYFGDKTIPLVYNASYSSNLTGGGSVPATFTYSSFNASFIQQFQLATRPSSTNINVVVENMQIEIINGGGSVIESGTYQFLFSSSAVNQKYLHNATNYLYSYFFQKPMLSIVAYNS